MWNLHCFCPFFITSFRDYVLRFHVWRLFDTEQYGKVCCEEAVITIPASGDDTELLAYDALEDRYRETIEDAHMTTNLYTFKDIQIDNTGTSPANGAPPNSIHVRIDTVLNKQYAFVNLLTGLGVGIPESYSINYYMYDENGSASDS